jgi:alpha-galactosidase
MWKTFWCVTLGALALSAGEVVPLTELDLSLMRQGWGTPQTNHTVTGGPLVIAGRAFAHGVGTHARSALRLDLGGRAERFQAWVGVDDAAGNARASLRFRVLADGAPLFDSGVMRWRQPARRVDVPLAGRTNLLLLVTDAGDGIHYDHADWAEAVFLMAKGRPRATDPAEPREIRTPRPGPAPRINGPRVYGCRPGHPFLFRIPTTGERPLRWEAEGLPDGVHLDANTGLLTGTAPARGEYVVTLRARNRHGQAERTFKIVAGDTLALTPPMGWNHWYAHYNRITDALVRQAAESMVRSGLADVGYQYISIDDCWMTAPSYPDPLRVGPLRDAEGRILPNRHFPDMRALTDFIHSFGLKAGIYTSPGPRTCAGFCGSYQHEAQDAATFAEWGFDLLKYDWCSYRKVATGEGLERLQKPYRLMGRLLREQPRDIVLNLCQYGMGEVWKWGAEVGGQSWRTAGDLGFELNRIFAVALKNIEHRQWNGPGSWNDPDYLQIGYIGRARGMGEPEPCPLTPNEQYAYMSLWCLMAAPLFYSGDMSRLDEFTLNVLGNPELIEVNQDPLGQCARAIRTGPDTFLLVKDLAAGGQAIGLFNRGELPVDITVCWADLGLAARQQVRDLWRQRDLGVVETAFTRRVGRRDGEVIRIRPAPAE